MVSHCLDRREASKKSNKTLYKVHKWHRHAKGAYQWLFSAVIKKTNSLHMEHDFQKSLTELQFVVKSECRCFYKQGFFLSH